MRLKSRNLIINEVAQEITDNYEISDILRFFTEKQEEFLENMNDKELIEYIKEYDLLENIDNFITKG